MHKLKKSYPLRVRTNPNYRIASPFHTRQVKFI